MTKFDRFYNFIDAASYARLYDFKDKQHNLKSRVGYMLSRLSTMFKYDGLPETIPQRMLELYLMVNGHCVVTSVNENLYAFTGGWGGVLDEYYRPTIYTIANPFLKFFDNLEIGANCVLCGNDSMYQGLLPMLEMYGTALVENELSMNIADINARIMSIITADNDKDYESAKAYLEHIKDGDLSAIGESAFFDGVKSQPYAQTGNRSITDLIEYEQYLKASMFNELGLNANYNMKRESLNSSESQMNNDALTPLVDDMLNMRKQFIEEINKKYGTDITIDLASAWKENEQEAEAELEAIEAESENVSRETSEKPAEETESEVEEDEENKETD